MASLYTAVVVLCVVLSASVIGQISSACVDTDTLACKQMVAQRADFCHDWSLAKAVCPKFCNLCPIQCYHCNTTVANIQECNTVKICGEGEVCMRKELKSYVDGHHEYQLSCEAKQHCDGTALTLPFGKRHVESRDLVISCCGSDLCNSAPVTTTTTTTVVPKTTTVASSCRKDFIVLVDGGRLGHDVANWIKGFLSYLTTKLDIGPDDALMSVALFANKTHVLWNLDTYTDQHSLHHAIGNTYFAAPHSHSADLHVALQFLVDHKASIGNRANADDVVIIVTEHHSWEAWSHHGLLQQVHAEYPDVYAFSAGEKVNSGELAHIATDASHVISIHPPDGHWSYSFVETIFNQVASMICS